MFPGMSQWERVATSEIGIGDTIDVDGRSADVTGIVGDGDAREFEVSFHNLLRGGVDGILTGAGYKPPDGHVKRMRQA